MTKVLGLLLSCSMTITLVHCLVCEREIGDELLSSQTALQISILGQSRIQKSFEGYKITCIQSSLPLGLGSLLDVSILEGGIGCDSVNLQVKITKLIVIRAGVKIYGRKWKDGENTNILECKNDTSQNFLEGLNRLGLGN